jgi:hypothetical protein
VHEDDEAAAELDVKLLDASTDELASIDELASTEELKGRG